MLSSRFKSCLCKYLRQFVKKLPHKETYNFQFLGCRTHVINCVFVTTNLNSKFLAVNRFFFTYENTKLKNDFQFMNIPGHHELICNIPSFIKNLHRTTNDLFLQFASYKTSLGNFKDADVVIKK